MRQERPTRKDQRLLYSVGTHRLDDGGRSDLDFDQIPPSDYVFASP